MKQNKFNYEINTIFAQIYAKRMIEITILTVIWGLLIGILVSAPMGPTGILVIQRTLNKGWLPGFLTGLGAILSDLFYAIITVFALQLVVDWIEQFEVSLQIFGGAFIALYGFYLWNSNPVEVMATNNENAQNPSPILTHHHLRVTGILKYFFTGFGLTVSNPMIVFFFLALYARTKFLFDADVEHWWLYLIGFGCIIIGALGWWTLITWTINKVRNHFRLRTIRNINRGIASIMFLIALIGFCNGVYILLTR